MRDEEGKLSKDFDVQAYGKECLKERDRLLKEDPQRYEFSQARVEAAKKLYSDPIEATIAILIMSIESSVRGAEEMCELKAIIDDILKS